MNIEEIKGLLDEVGLSFTELAEKMGKERSVVYKTIQNGNPTLSFLIKLSEALGKTIDEIVYLPQSPNTPEEEKTLIDGFVEANGRIHRVRSTEDLRRLLESIEK